MAHALPSAPASAPRTPLAPTRPPSLLALAALGLAALGLAACCAAPPPAPAAPEAAPEPRSELLRQLADEALRLRPLFPASPLVQRFLDAARTLPPRATRTVVVGGETKSLDEVYYYAARWGTPLAYARALELVEASGGRATPGARWLDFGFGAPGHLQMLGRLGLDLVGVDVDPVGAALYVEPEDVAAPPGTLALRYGRWPGEPAVRAAVGQGFDVILSKNVLKRGYIHPARAADPKHLIDLGVDDATFLAALHDALRPGGLVVLWNLCPGQAPLDKPYIPWADGESPWPREAWEAAGFEVLALSVDDAPRARELAHALGFDAPDEDGQPGWDLEHDLGAWTTIARRRP